ncbi:MAG: hypothetical protein QOI04_2166 [Verrucomicrobiota bacterium]
MLSARARRTRRIFLIVMSILLSAHRLPAPIIEPEEKATPAEEQSEAPKQKQSAKPRASSTETEPAKPIAKTQAPKSKFAGTWTGTMQTFPWGPWEVALTIDANESTMTEQINTEKPLTKPAKRNGEMLQARFPSGLTTVTWSLTPQADDASMNVHFQALMNDFTSVFHRAAAAQHAAPAPTVSAQAVTSATVAIGTPKLKTDELKRANTQASDVPTAKAVPEKPGYVFNPFDPSAKTYLDVRGIASGTRVKVPSSGRSFIVP